jgi:hypothetical protein
MTEDEETPITLSREDLYELVWSKPMRELAKDFGISDVALAKRCRRLGIPVPGRGYWARVDAGQQPYRAKLPKREPERSDQGALTVAPSADASPTFNALPAATQDQVWLEERLAFEQLPDSNIEVPATTRTWDPAIKDYRDNLEEAAEEMRSSRKACDRYEKWPEWRKRVESDRNTWAWRHAKDRGQRLRDFHKPTAIRVSLDTYERALRLANTLALAAAIRGFTVSKDDKIGRIAFTGHNADIQLRITEMLQDKTRPSIRYDGKTETETYQVPTGRLRLTLQTGYREGPSFEDRESHTLESQLNRVFPRMYRLVVKVWEQDRRHLEFHRQLEEDSRRRAESERIRAQRKRLLAEERSRKRRLSVEAIRWTKSCRIREYVDHIRIAARAREVSTEELGNWADWALSVASELDPTEKRLKPRIDGDSD